MQCNYRKCKRDAVIGHKVCEHHADINRRKAAKQVKKYKTAGCRYCPQPNLPGLKVCNYHRDRNRERSRNYHAQLKKEVIEYYGGICSCCKESRIEFLTIDHINNDGMKHRKTERIASGGGTYSWLKRNGYPTGFQVLCWNCNAAKALYGSCPHIATVARGNMKQILVVMQGWSGSGKSTLARQVANVIDAEIFSTDEFFIVDGVYKFDPSKLGIFHKMNLERSITAMKNGKNVIVDNTNLSRWESKGYVQAALELGITVRFVRATGNFANTHGVSLEKVEQMKTRLEDLTIETVMASKPPWEK